MSVTRGDAIVRAARDRLGVRFRAQGRGGAGLDCVGLVAAACGPWLRASPPADYAQRGGSLAAIRETILAAGFMPVFGAAAGDLLLIEAGPAQWHLAIWTGAGFVHADARLRRVVETPGWPGWPVAGVFRASEGES